MSAIDYDTLRDDSGSLEMLRIIRGQLRDRARGMEDDDSADPHIMDAVDEIVDAELREYVTAHWWRRLANWIKPPSEWDWEKIVFVGVRVVFVVMIALFCTVAIHVAHTAYQQSHQKASIHLEKK